MWLNVGVKGKRLDMKESGGNQEIGKVEFRCGRVTCGTGHVKVPMFI